MFLRLLCALVVCCAVFASPAVASHSTTFNGVALHQVSDSGTAFERTVNFYEVLTANYSGATWEYWVRNEAGPAWRAHALLNLPTGAQMDLGENYPSCTFKPNGDANICNASSWNTPAQWGGLAEYSVYPNGHLTTARIRLDENGSGMSTPGNVCSYNTIDTTTGQARIAYTNCGWAADAVLHHEMGHILGLAHPPNSVLQYSPMGHTYHWHATQGCSYNTPPPGTGHACTFPDSHDMSQISISSNHVDANGPNPAPLTASQPTARSVRSEPPDMMDLGVVPKDGAWHKVNRQGGAIRTPDREWIDARWDKDGAGRDLVRVRAFLPVVKVHRGKDSPIGEVHPAFRDQVRKERAGG